MNQWHEFVDAVAETGDVDTPADADRYVTPAAIRAWIEARLSEITPEQLAYDIAGELCNGGTRAQCELLVNRLAEPDPRADVLYGMAEALRRLVMIDLRDGVVSRNLFDFERTPRCQYPEHSDAIAEDRRALAADFNTVLRP
jgi:hypothetical protein